jgi:hypothetical protein
MSKQLKARTAADSSTLAQLPTSSKPCTKPNVSGSLPKTMKQLKAILFTAYLVGRDDEQKGGRSFSDWFEDVVERQ